MAYAGERVVRQFGIEMTIYDTLDVEVSLGSLRDQLDALIVSYGRAAQIERVEVITRGRDEPDVSYEFRIVI